MRENHFFNLFSDAPMPVVICKNLESFPVIYTNFAAELTFAPSKSFDRMIGDNDAQKMSDIIEFTSKEERGAFLAALSSTGIIDNYRTGISIFDESVIDVVIFGNTVSIDEYNDHFIFYILLQNCASETESANESTISFFIDNALISEDINDAINTILAIAGRRVGASRSYIFEEVSPAATRNTYEWCAEGVDSAIGELQNLGKDEYNYEKIIGSGMFVVDDVNKIPDEMGREILMAQGIRALAILTIYAHGKAIGYMGFDDCDKPRRWRHDEIQFFKIMSAFVSSLIKRRNAEQAAEQSRRALQIVSDNLGDLVYASSLEDHSLLFVNKAATELFKKSSDELLGKKCWEMFGHNQTGPCAFCPISKISETPENERPEVYVWESCNPEIGRILLSKASVVKWVDGKYALLHTASDITRQKKHEEQLSYFASTDMMTGIYNREWGAKLLSEALAKSKPGGSLCFVDLDGLKKINDTLGHEQGDRFIVDTVKIIRNGISEDELFCRWGGDEFLLRLNGGVEGAGKKIERMLLDIEEYNRRPDRQFDLSFSYGIVPFSNDGATSLDSLVTAADKLMYENKIHKKGLNGRRRRTD